MADRNLTPAGDATSLASSSSTLESNINSSVYDVFINHRGPDVKKGLASHIYRGLIGQGLRVFLDQRVLQEGERITPQIEGAIRTASVHIAIFSPGYAKSRWCLDELLLMVNSRSTILPVFYNVQPLDLRWTRGENGVYAQALSIFLCILLSVLLCISLSFLFRFLMCVPFSIIMCILLCTRGENGVYARDLRWTRGKDGVYARALRELQNKRTFDPETNETKPRHDSDTIEKWRKALSDVSEISGFELKKYNDDEGELVHEVVQQVLRKMVISLPQSLRDMEVEVERLNNLIHGINVKLAQVQMNPNRVVKAWLDKAGEAIESSQSIRSDHQQHKICTGCCPDCYRISKLTRDWKVRVAQLHSERQSDFPPNGEYGDCTPPAQIEIEIPRPGFVGNAIQSAQLKLEEMLTEDSNIRIIGVYGMGGVGKTSLLQTINNSLRVRNAFDTIIWVTVSRDYNILNLQDCIASRLKLQNFPDKSDLEGRKQRLRYYLRDTKFLMILDDMWESLELQSLGVSLNDIGSKIVLTTRNREVCTSMDAQEITRVEPLSDKEGWQLFCSRAFRNGNVPQEIEAVAMKIAGECKGLPLAINVVAAAMRNNTYQHQWEHALRQMQNIDQTFYGMHYEIEKKLFQSLIWSYNVLQDDLKTCFVYFAAFPEDAEIRCEEIIDVWVAEGLVKSSGDSYLPDTGHSFIDFLRDRCLIEVVATDPVGRIVAVKIHDVLRDLAIRIAEKDHKCYFKAGQGVSLFPFEGVDSEGCAKLSLMNNDLQSLPTSCAFSSLSVLLLRQNSGIKEVPESFLRELSSLRVLDLSQTGISSLPPSVGNLKHLAYFQLEHTDICELPETIGDLKELQVLNLRSCNKLRCLPERISELKRLRALDITECTNLSHLPRGISELVGLERLSMCLSIDLDFEEEANGEERKYGCLKDLQSLRRLRVFVVKIKSPVKEGVMGNWSKMRDLLLNCTDANQEYLPQDMQVMKDLESFVLFRCDVERLPSWVTEFQKLAFLRLFRCEQLKELPAELPCLRELWIRGCNKLEELELGMGFPKLERLNLEFLRSLECVGAVAAASGSGGLGEGASPLPPMLKSLFVLGCPKLKRLRGGWDKLKCVEEIFGSREWWDAIQWEDPNMKTSLESKLKYIV